MGFPDGNAGLISLYLTTLLGLAAGQAAPGPNFLAVTATALSQGGRAARFVSFGVACATALWVTAAACGLGGLLALWPRLLTGLSVLGGAYLLWMAVRALRGMIRALLRPVPERTEGVAPQGLPHRTAFQAWRYGLLVNLTNPKSAMVWAAIAAYMLSAGLSPVQVIGFAPLGFTSALLIYGAYAVLFSRPAVRRAYGRFSPAFDGLYAAVFGLLGATLLADAAAALLA